MRVHLHHARTRLRALLRRELIASLSCRGHTAGRVGDRRTPPGTTARPDRLDTPLTLPPTLVRVITRYYPVLSVPAATIRGMAGDQETVTTAAAVRAGGDLVPRAGAEPLGPGAIAAELLARTRAELPVLAGLGEREELLAAVWLASLRAARTRRAYAADVRGWLGWLADRGVDVLDAARVHVDLWAAAQQDRGTESSTVRRRLSALSSFYRYCAAHDLVDRIPTAGVARPGVDPDYTATIGLDRDQARALVAAADADRGPQALRTAAVIRLLLHNALRVDEACAADVTDLGADAGHRVLRVIRKGARRAKVPLAPATVAALDASARGTCGNWSAAWPATRASRPGTSYPRTACGTRRSPSHSTPAPHSATSRTTPGTRTPAQPAGTTTPGTAWTATPPTRSRPTSPDRNHSRQPSVARPLRLRPRANPSRAPRPESARPSAPPAQQA